MQQPDAFLAKRAASELPNMLTGRDGPGRPVPQLAASHQDRFAIVGFPVYFLQKLRPRLHNDVQRHRFAELEERHLRGTLGTVHDHRESHRIRKAVRDRLVFHVYAHPPNLGSNVGFGRFFVGGNHRSMRLMPNAPQMEIKVLAEKLRFPASINEISCC